MLTIDIERRQGDFLIQAAIRQSQTGVTALFGPSGAGKTSIVNMVAGLMAPDRGHIRINDTTLFDSNRKVNLPPEKRRIGYVFQDGRLFPHLTVRRNLVYGMKRISPEERVVDFDSVVELLGIDHLLERRPAKLSGGEKQRVAIGRALLTSPRLLLMDEPLASLDTARKQEVLPFIQRLCREFHRPILYVSHSLGEIRQLSTHMALLSDGRVTAFGSTDEMLGRTDLNACIRLFDSGISYPDVA